jgi:hypothetical protein
MIPSEIVHNRLCQNSDARKMAAAALASIARGAFGWNNPG